MFIAPASAQNAPTRIKTLRVAPTNVQPMYQVDSDGAVRIDWASVEQAAKSAGPSKDVASVMLAIRAGSWKPME
jgi:hypothetical protein